MTGDDRPTIRCQTITGLWLFQRHMYSLGSHGLWVPIPHRAIGWVAAVFVPWWVLLATFRVPFTGVGLTAHFAVPGVAVWWVLRVVGDGVRPQEIVGSWVRLVWHVARRHDGRSRVSRVGGSVRSPVVGAPVRVCSRPRMRSSV